MATKLARFCGGLLEAGWLAALISVPLFFNIHSERVFEPDKVAILRSVAVLLLATLLVRFIDQSRSIEWKRLRWSHPTSIWRQPFVLPLAALVVVYVIASSFSITTRVSWLGSYQRLQGTYTTLSYIVFFVAAVLTVFSRFQINRIVTAAIIASIPVAFYGLLQHYGLDPLPWGGDVTVRIAGHMGNAIFVSAYLIMVVPLTVARIIDASTNILGDDEVAISDVARSALYVFTLAIQLLAVHWSGSRGPMIGLIIALFSFFLVLLVSLRNAQSDRDAISWRDAAKALLIVLPPFAALLLSGAVGKVSSAAVSLGLFLLAILVSLAGMFLTVVLRRGWQWLWLSWLLLATLVAGWLLIFNLGSEALSEASDMPLAGPMLREQLAWKELPGVGSYGRMLDPSVTTGRERSNRVRVLIWEGVVELLSPHSPLVFPDGTMDRFNFWRPLIGYGPESMYVAYNRFYPAELATVEARNASPDRSHNETFDALVITGFAGLLAWQALYLSVFYFGFKYLGVVVSRRDGAVLAGSWIGGALGGALLSLAALGLIYLGVLVPLGTIVGLIIYLFYYALFARPSRNASAAQTNRTRVFRADRLLMNALLAAVLAHYVELHLGIAIAPTRLHFFLFIAVIFILVRRGTSLFSQPKKEASKAPQGRVKRDRTPVETDLGPVWAWAFLLALLLGTLGYNFTNYVLPQEVTIASGADLSAWDIFQQSLFVNPQRDSAPSPYVFLLVLISWLVGVVIILSEMIRQERHDLGKLAATSKMRAVAFPALILGSVSFVLGLGYTLIQAFLLREALLYLIFLQGIEPISPWYGLLFAPQEGVESVVQARVLEARQAARFISSYYLLLFGVILSSGFALSRWFIREAKTRGRLPAFGAAVVAVILASLLIAQSNLRPVQADMVFKRGRPFDEQAMRAQDPLNWDVAIAIYEEALKLNPLEDYYYLFLGRAYLERSALANSEQERLALLNQAQRRLLFARELNPLNSDHSANLARLQTRWAVSSREQGEQARHLESAEAYYRDALLISPQNSVVRNELARLYFDLRADCESSIELFERSLAIDPFFAETYFAFGEILTACGQAQTNPSVTSELFERAIVVLEQGLRLETRRPRSWIQVGQLYQELGQFDEAAAAFSEARDTNVNVAIPIWHIDFIEAEFYRAMGELAMARALAEQALGSAPDSVARQIEAFIEALP